MSAIAIDPQKSAYDNGINYRQCLAFCRSHCYKLIASTLLFFIMLQYVANISVYNSTYLNTSTSSVFRSFNIPIMNITREANHNTSQKVRSYFKPTSYVSELFATNNKTIQSSLQQCPLVPKRLVGRLKVLKDATSFEKLEAFYPNLEPGGRFRPKTCISRQKVAIIIAYRDRAEHLNIFLLNIHPILMRQELDYGIYVIEQSGNFTFNRAKLFNIGYTEALKQYDYECFIFHDVDLIPEDDRNLYKCSEQPRHMSVAVDVWNYRLPYKTIFGGVAALSKQQMIKVNGFSNMYWGWGGEDDDMFNRINAQGFSIARYPPDIARYSMLKHKKDTPNPARYSLLYKSKHRFKSDGLNNLNYKREDIVFKKLYTWVLVDPLPPEHLKQIGKT